MSAETFRAAGFKAIEERKWSEAIDSLSKAIAQSKSPAWLLARSQAYMETGKLDEAIADADYAYCTAAERGNDKSRKQMIEAQYRRSVCFFRKKQYANADKCAVWSQRLAKGVAVSKGKTVAQEGVNEKGYYFATAAQAMAEGAKNETKGEKGNDDPMARLSAIMGAPSSDKTPYEKDWNKAQIWRTQVLHFLEALPAEDPARKITVELTPKKPDLGTGVQPPKIDKGKAVATTPEPPKPTPAPAPDYTTFRTQFYQSETSITVSFMMKFPSKEAMGQVEVRFLDGGKFVCVKGVPRQPPLLFITPHERISVSKSTWRAASMKLEFTFVKEVPGKWPDFGTQSSSVPPAVAVEAESSLAGWLDLPPIAEAETISAMPITKEKVMPSQPPAVSRPAEARPMPTATKAPAYPTSSKSGPKDWDSIGKDDDDEDDAKDVDHFFKQLYKGSTPEQQRAMMKSYLESNGTALSTDWNEVSKGKVETSPPTGMEEKKWGA
ncbi:hypothetical protein KVR01_009079 [Diaporthe batatas]|uniref:co-chaperone SGT1 n=1 Tax=Diaporthe batatas TaxID=748121 RepID=UPI001D05B791|nr:co-chaperone SGT1 [Diaporthe batatas]KAG8160815.1 hypothetical protein KVR01_009079 [Diaporthe batatas]